MCVSLCVRVFRPAFLALLVRHTRLGLFSRGSSRDGGGKRQVHEVVYLALDGKPAKRDDFDPTRDGATSAVVSRAMRRVRMLGRGT